MKYTRIVFIIVAIVLLGVIIGFLFEADTYSDFEKANASPGSVHQIIGKPDTTRAERYDTIGNKVYFSFYMTDRKGETMNVVYKGMKPRDFEKLAELVVTGRVQDGRFIAGSMLMKCPSKYNSSNQPEGFGKKEVKAE